LLAKPTQLNINLSSDRFAMFNKQRDITQSLPSISDQCASATSLSRSAVNMSNW
jgi:hypothetical protein